MKWERNIAFSKRHDYVYLMGFYCSHTFKSYLCHYAGEFAITLEHSELLPAFPIDISRILNLVFSLELLQSILVLQT